MKIVIILLFIPCLLLAENMDKYSYTNYSINSMSFNEGLITYGFGIGLGISSAILFSQLRLIPLGAAKVDMTALLGVFMGWHIGSIVGSITGTTIYWSLNNNFSITGILLSLTTATVVSALGIVSAFIPIAGIVTYAVSIIILPYIASVGYHWGSGNAYYDSIDKMILNNKNINQENKYCINIIYIRI